MTHKHDYDLRVVVLGRSFVFGDFVLTELFSWGVYRRDVLYSVSIVFEEFCPRGIFFGLILSLWGFVLGCFCSRKGVVYGRLSCNLLYHPSIFNRYSFQQNKLHQCQLAFFLKSLGEFFQLPFNFRLMHSCSFSLKVC